MRPMLSYLNFVWALALKLQILFKTDGTVFKMFNIDIETIYGLIKAYSKLYHFQIIIVTCPGPFILDLAPDLCGPFLVSTRKQKNYLSAAP